MKRSDRLVEVHGLLHGQRRGRPTQLDADVLRAAVVLAVAALDDLVHTVSGTYDKARTVDERLWKEKVGEFIRSLHHHRLVAR